MSKIFLELANLKKSFDHTKEPITLFDNVNIKIKEGDRYNLFTLRDIKAEEEITLKYTFYKIW